MTAASLAAGDYIQAVENAKALAAQASEVEGSANRITAQITASSQNNMILGGVVVLIIVGGIVYWTKFRGKHKSKK